MLACCNFRLDRFIGWVRIGWLWFYVSCGFARVVGREGM
jgi:hypothetical protein